MFDLSYSTRTLLCRAGFVAGCVAPTAAVLLWAGWLRLPSHSEACRQQIEQSLRLPTTLAAVSHPRPGLIDYQAIEIVDPETGRAMVRIPRLEAGQNESSQVLIAREVEIDAAALPQLGTRLAERLRDDSSATTLLAGKVVVVSGREPQTLEQVVGKLETLPTGPQFSLQFNIVGSESPQPMRFKLARVRSAAGAETGIELDTGGSAIPCSLAESLVGWLTHVGPDAAFDGRLVAFHGDDGWRGELQGRLAGIDLAQLAGDHLPLAMTGQAELRIDRARFARSRLVEVVGRLTAGPGELDALLLSRAVDVLELNHQLPAKATGPLKYEQLSFDFRLDGQGLMLAGCCQDAPLGAVLVDASQWLLGEPKHQPQPAAKLIQALSPADSQNVPATRHSGWLLEVLPLP